MSGVANYGTKFTTGAVTGNNNTPAGRSIGAKVQIVVANFTAGATPTVAVAIQGSFDGVAWQTLVFTKEGAAAETKVITVTETATGYFYYVISKGWWPYIRINLSANTNMTLNEGWLVEQGA